MPQDIDDDLDELDSDDGPRTNSDFAALRREKKAARDALAEAEKAKREVAFLRAGIDPEDKRLAYFVRGYDGKSDVESIRSAAVEAGFLTPPAPDAAQVEAQQQSQEATQTAASIASLAQGGEQAPSALAADDAAMKEAFRNGGADGLAAFLSSKGVPQITS